jgi:RNA polymerase sigma factor (sigma-70 family)
MSRSDSEKPPASKPPTATTPRAIVRDRPARAPASKEPEPRKPSRPRAIIIPENQLAEGQNAFIASLYQQWGGLIENELSRYGDIAAASRPDAHQAVRLILGDHYLEERKAGRDPAPENPAAFLRTIVDGIARNHGAKKRRRPKLELGDEGMDEALDAGPDPERATIVAELQEKVGDYLDELTTVEREVFEAREVDGVTFDLIARARGLSKSTVFNIHARAKEKLGDRARASERDAKLGPKGPGAPRSLSRK